MRLFLERIVRRVDQQYYLSEGCPRLKTNTFVWKWFSFMAECMFEGVSENSRRMGVREPRYHSSVWV